MPLGLRSSLSSQQSLHIPFFPPLLPGDCKCLTRLQTTFRLKSHRKGAGKHLHGLVSYLAQPLGRNWCQVSSGSKELDRIGELMYACSPPLILKPKFISSLWLNTPCSQPVTMYRSGVCSEVPCLPRPFWYSYHSGKTKFEKRCFFAQAPANTEQNIKQGTFRAESNYYKEMHFCATAPMPWAFKSKTRAVSCEHPLLYNTCRQQG